MRRLVTGITVMLGAAVLAGCIETGNSGSTSSTGGPDTINTDAPEGVIIRTLEKRLGPDLRVEGVTCPERVKLVEGMTFECTARIDGVQVPLVVTLTRVDEVGEQEQTFSFETKPTKAPLLVETLEKGIKAWLAAEVAGPGEDISGVTVDCGPGRLRVVEVGGTMECTIVDGGGSAGWCASWPTT